MPMSDQELATDVRAKITALNTAIADAYTAGLRMTGLRVTETQVTDEVATKPTVGGPDVIGRPL